MIGLDMDRQRQGYLRPEPSILLGRPSNYPQPNVHAIATSSDLQYLPEGYDGSMFYGRTQYNATSGSFYYPYMTPLSSNGVFGVPINHVLSEQFSFSGHDVRDTHFIDEVRGPYKRKSSERNFQSSNGSASSSSSVPFMNARPSSSVRIDSVWVHDHNSHLTQGNYMGQNLQLPAGSLSVDAPSWNRVSARPYNHGNNLNAGTIETLNSGVYRNQEVADNGTFRHPHINHGQQRHPHPSGSSSATGQGVRGPHNINFHSQVAAASHSFPLPSSRSSSTTGRLAYNGLDIRRRQPGPVPPTGFRIYRPHREAMVPGAGTNMMRPHNVPHLRVLQADEVALLEIPDFYEVGDFVDHHRDLRLDIEEMSYEELLALGERIGNVTTGFSEEVILNQIKTKNYVSSSSVTVINLEEASSEDQEASCCVICQENYQNEEKIGIIKCGHEYHVDCLKKWLQTKNVCPICKSEAVTTGKKAV